MNKSVGRIQHATREKLIKFFQEEARQHGREFTATYSEINRKTGLSPARVPKVLEVLQAEGHITVRPGPTPRAPRIITYYGDVPGLEEEKELSPSEQFLQALGGLISLDHCTEANLDIGQFVISVKRKGQNEVFEIPTRADASVDPAKEEGYSEEEIEKLFPQLA